MIIYLDGKKVNIENLFSDFSCMEKTAVISLDMCEGHISDAVDCPCPAPRLREIVAPINAFHVEARSCGVPIIHVRSVLRKGGIDDVKAVPSAWRRTFPLHAGTIMNSDAHAIEGSFWTQFVTDVREGDLIVNGKKRLSAFYPTDLDLLLRSLGVRTVVLNGGMADCCILNTAFDAANLDYRVILAADLVRGTNASMEEFAMRCVSLHLGVVMDAEDIISLWHSEK